MTKKIDALPDRPLEVNEAEKLAESDLKSITFAPLSILTPPDGGDLIVTTLAYANKEEDTSAVVGYSPVSEEWEIIKSWSTEEWTVEKQEEAVDEWARENYGEEEVEHGFVNVDEL